MAALLALVVLLEDELLDELELSELLLDELVLSPDPDELLDSPPDVLPESLSPLLLEEPFVLVVDRLSLR